MKTFNFLWRSRILMFVSLFLVAFHSEAQVQTARFISTNPRSNAFYEYLPQGYNSGSEKYPLIIFIHGMGELGAGTSTSLPLVLRNGPPKLINQGVFPTSFTVNGQTHKFIVISPQFTEWPGPSDINLLINYAIQNYRVDESRIYLTGLSMGGGVVWEYAGSSAVYANRVAAMIPICGASWPDQGRANVIAAADVAVWATHNSGDPTAPVFYTNDYVTYINNAPNPPTPLAKKTIFTSNSHDAWSMTYSLTFKENNLNVYEWMLTNKRTIGTNLPPVPNAGADKTITLPVNSVRFEATATDPDGSLSTIQWTKVSGPSSGTIENPGGLWTNIINLTQGVYVFRLSVVDNGGALGTDEVTVTVNGSTSLNQLPVANAGADQTITLPVSSATLSGSGSDPDGTITSYSWTKVSGPSGGSISSPSSATTQISGLTEGSYNYRLTVTDNSGGTRSDDVVITVVTAPVITPGDPKTVKVNIFGGSYPYSNTQWNNWNTNTGLTSGTFLNTDLTSSGISAVLTSQAGISDNGSSYGSNATAFPKEVIRHNSYNTSNRTLTLRGLNPSARYTLQFYGSRANTGNKTVLLINGIRDTINTDNNISDFASFSNVAPDNSGRIEVEIYRVGTYNYLAGFMISEGGTTIPPVNQPPVANAGTDMSITLPVSSVNLTGSGTDNDGSISSYSWTKISGPSASITNPTAAYTSVTALLQGSYIFRLTVTDNNGATHSDDVSITVNAATANQLPVANAGADKIITLPVSSVLLAGSGTDPDGSVSSYQWYQISGPVGGLIETASSANTTVSSLTAGTYTYRLTVTDNSGGNSTDDVMVTVNPEPVSGGGKVINVNVFNGTTAYANTEWNNWKVVSNTSSTTFKYSDQTPSTVAALITGSAGIADNGSGYASAATVIPKEVLRFNSYNTSNRALVLTGLIPGGSYDLKLYGSRANSGNKTVVQFGSQRDTISTDNNVSDFAQLVSLTADNSGRMEIDIYRIGTYSYIAGFTLVENTASRNLMTTSSSELNNLVQLNGDPEIRQLYELTAFPNPVQDVLNISVKTNAIENSGTIYLMDGNGRVIFSSRYSEGQKEQHFRFNMTGLPSGNYILYLKAESRSFSKQVIKI